MNKIEIHVGENFDKIAERVAVNWHRAECGEALQENHINFKDWDVLAKVMSTKRYQLLRYVHTHPIPSIAALARALHRGYKRVYDDVQILISAGLLSNEQGIVSCNYDIIESRIFL